MDAEFADLDNDGIPELILAAEFGPNLVLERGPRTNLRHRVDALPQRRLSDSEAIAVADLNGDGRVEIVFAAEDDAAHELYLYDAGSNAYFDASERLEPAVGMRCNAIVATDLDGDGDTDLIFGGDGPERALINDGTARFRRRDGIIPARNDVTQDLELGDIDGDGDLDLIAGNEDGNRIYIREGDRFVDETERRLPEPEAPEVTREADLGDIDGDGDLDLLLANTSFGSDDPDAAINRLLLNDGTGVFHAAPPGSLPARNRQSTFDAEFVDIDADGDPDLVLANSGRGGPDEPPVQLWLNDGRGGFTDETDAAIPRIDRAVWATDVEARDLNGDGLIDLYITNHRGPDVVLMQR